jgi:hypothetical protein
LLAALTLPSGIYNVCRDGERVSNRRFSQATGWHPEHQDETADGTHAVIHAGRGVWRARAARSGRLVW